ncbi:trypsin-like [Babylonia areolata]|uniref:trypsin-like n=1 Tax=Babylonia areolata TaxID=304850 RepID=UPI003FD58D48
MRCYWLLLFLPHLAFPAEHSEEKRIVYGEDATYGDLPCICSLKGLGIQLCGAFIYNSNTLISAAHCFDNRDWNPWIQAVCGEYKLYEPDGYEFTVDISTILIHPNYSRNLDEGSPNDLALLRTATPMNLAASRYVRSCPIDDGTATLPASCLLAGWGLTENETFPDVLQKVNSTRLTNARCRELLGANPINGGHVCFKNVGTLGGACTADSGGPAVCGNVVVGVTTWGRKGCRSRTFPSVYTRLSHFHTWIRDNAF